MTEPVWQLEMGARVLGGGRARFRVYAPQASRVDVEIYPWPGGVIDRFEMKLHAAGNWDAEIDAAPGTLYRYRLDDEWAYPDPYSRSQPEDVHGPSMVVDPSFPWTDGTWRGVAMEDLVIYEVHVGTFTLEGTFEAIIPLLPELRDLGITGIELMPVVEFPGDRNWGYDGAHRFAPESSYGSPDELRRLIDAAHAHGLAVLLDVVYNHLGPDGDYLMTFVPDILTARYRTPWGSALNFDSSDNAFARKFVIDNVLYWMHEFHIDGFRVDAAHEIYDSSEPHILQELARTVHERAPQGKRCLMIAEDERNRLSLLVPGETGGYGLDGEWVDDFHHSVQVLLTNERDGYLNAYQGSTEELARLLKSGFVYCDATAVHEDALRSISREQLVYCVQNHDQVGNRPFGKRMADQVGLELFKAAYCLLLLSPGTPLIFMGDEHAASSPFLYFTDHHHELGRQTRAGRRAEFRHFWASKLGPGQDPPDSQDRRTFERSKIDRSALSPEQAGVRRLFAGLLRLRNVDPVFSSAAAVVVRTEAVSSEVLAMERATSEGRRLVVVNFGNRARYELDGSWSPLLCTAEEQFGGACRGLSVTQEGRAVVELCPRSAAVWASGSQAGAGLAGRLPAR